ncbi:replication-relaxation family protein [Saccharopolyspora cebuensis]|uniref:replication-relaxation family protein n=1 Tax=Saccharopolyspora cebuensis TaxID=418759 RepID=UPI0031ED3634
MPVRQAVLRNARTDRRTPRAANTAEHQARLASRLTARDRWLVAMLHEHRVLTGDQIAALAFPTARGARARLRNLWCWSVLDRFQPVLARGTAPMHYVLGPAGATVLATGHGLDTTDLGYRRNRTLGIAHSLRLAHTIGCNQLLTDLATHGHLRAWWSEQRCARSIGDLARPDAYAHWATPCGELGFFVEYDTGTEALGKLAAKLAGYHDLARATGQTTALLFWFPSTHRETHARRTLHRTWTEMAEPGLLPIATASREAPHPSADAWLPLETSGPRRPLDQLPHTWPQLTPAPPDGESPPTSTNPALPPPPPQPPTKHPRPR